MEKAGFEDTLSLKKFPSMILLPCSITPCRQHILISGTEGRIFFDRKNMQRGSIIAMHPELEPGTVGIYYLECPEIF